MHERHTERIHPAPRLVFTLLVVLLVVTWPGIFPPRVGAQVLTGALTGVIEDSSGGVFVGARVRVSSPALMSTGVVTSDEKGRWRFPALPPGRYVLDIEVAGFTSYHEENIPVTTGSTLTRTIVLDVAGVSQWIAVEGVGSGIEARDSGISTRYDADDLAAIPTRRSSMFDFIRATPGVSPTSPSSGTITTVSVFGSGTNENQFLFDGTNFTCPCNGVARAEPGVDFIQEIQVQSVGASAEFGNVQGAVFNVVMKQGGDRFVYDAAYYGQTARLTSQPVHLPLRGGEPQETGYTRARYRDVSTTLGGPVVRRRVWFFAGYQHLRDADSQPGSDPTLPRTYEQDKIFAKVTWNVAPGWQLVHSFHDEFWLNPSTPTRFTPFVATTRTEASVPAMTFVHLTHAATGQTSWDVRLGRFVYEQEGLPSTGDRETPSRFDRATGITSGAPAQFGNLTIARTTAKATVDHYRPGSIGMDHQLRAGIQIEQGEHHAETFTPGGMRFVDNAGQSFQLITRAPSIEAGAFESAALFVSDAITVGNRITVNAGVRFDHSRAISPDRPTLDGDGRAASAVIPGLGHLYTWNILSPRLGITARLTRDARTMLRGSYGRFSQGMLTGEIAPFHPGVSAIRTDAFDPATGGYTRHVSTVLPVSNLQLDRQSQAPRTDEYSVGVDRAFGSTVAVAVAYVHKSGANFIGWTDVGGRYAPQTRFLPDGRAIEVFEIENRPADRRFLLTNPDEYSLRYDGVVMMVDMRRSRGWDASGSYTFSRTSGLQPSSGTSAAGAQVSTVAPPNPSTFGRDPNDLTNATGRLPNDRPHVLRFLGSADIPRTGLVVAANLQYFSGKPWAATAQIVLAQGDQRVLLEPRGSRRLPSQTLLDVRVSRPVRLPGSGRLELMLDVLNVLNDTAAESIASDNLFSVNFGAGSTFIDPRRAMLSARLTIGR